jgi:hypothetical protein
MNPTAPSIRGLPKIHKVNCPIRPIINWRNEPAYKLAKTLNTLFHFHIPLPNVFNVKNSIQLQKQKCSPEGLYDCCHCTQIMLGKLMTCLDTLSALLLELQDVSVFVEGFLVPQP